MIMGMKFHKFYVAIINPLGIIVAALLAIVLLVGALSIDSIATDVADEISEVAQEVTSTVNIPLFGDLEADSVLWLLFGLAAALFLFMLMTEFLLVSRKKFGIVLLSFSLLLGIASNIVGYINYAEQTPWYTMAISVVVSALILIYYWKRYPEFG